MRWGAPLVMATWTLERAQTAEPLTVLEHLAELQRHRNQLDAYESALICAAGGTNVAAWAGERDLSAALSKTQGVSRGEAKKRRKTALSRDEDPQSADAMDAGEITADQLNDLAGADVPKAERDRLRDEARDQSTDETRAAIGAAEKKHRKESADERRTRLRRKRTARRWTDRDGMRRFEFSLDPDAAAPVDAGLTAIVDRLFRTDRDNRDTASRREDQRLADAFAEAVGTAGHSTTGVGATIGITIDLAALRDETDTAGVTDHGTEISPSEVRRLAATANIIPIVLGAGSEPLDVGRSRRIATNAQRRAMIARDRGCVYPGCTAPPSACHVHHLIDWIRGGPTDLRNLVLLCHHHHSYLHASGLQLIRESDGSWNVVTADGRPVGPTRNTGEPRDGPDPPNLFAAG